MLSAVAAAPLSAGCRVSGRVRRTDPWSNLGGSDVISGFDRCAHWGRALAVLGLVAPAAVHANPLPTPDLPVRKVVQGAAIGPFLSELVAPVGAPVTVSPKITGTISGVFEGKLQTVLARVTSAFGAAYYYDGQTISFYPASERVVQTFRLGSNEARNVLSEATREGLTDATDTLDLHSGHLIASGAPQFIAKIQAIASRSGAPVRPHAAEAQKATGQRADHPDPVEYRVYPLRYGWAADTRINSGDRLITIPGVASILSALVVGTSAGREVQAQTTVVAKPAAQPGLAGSGLSAIGKESSEARAQPNTLAELFGLGAATAKPPVESKPLPAEAPPYEIGTPSADQFRVEADPRLNAVIVRDVRSNLDLYAPLIAALDVEPTLVQIEATIIDVDIDRAKQAGFNLSFRQPNGSGFTSSLDGVIANFPQPGGLSVSAVIGDRNLFNAKIEALESEGAARIVSSPLVMTLSDVEATFQNNQTFYVPVNGSLSTDLYNVTAGTNLRVTPHVTRDKSQNRIRLIVEIDDGAITSQVVGAIPVVQKASLNTEALILSGQSLLVGGMVSESTVDSHARIPGVSAVPVLGQLFRASRKTAGHTERLFLITPRLAEVGEPMRGPAGSGEVASKAGQPPSNPEARP
jgi:type III secretion protein C